MKMPQPQCLPLLSLLLPLIFGTFMPAPAAAADVPRYRITIPSGMASRDPGGVVRFFGTATALLRVRGLTVLIDPGADGAVSSPDMAGVDLVLLSNPDWSGVAGAGWGTGWRGRPVVAMAGSAERLRSHGIRSVYPLDTWEGITVRKGGTRLRVTSMPDPLGARPALLAAMLDFGPSCRVLVNHGDLSATEIGLIPQRFPGARMALLRHAGTPLLLAMEKDGGEPVPAHPVARGEPYRFGSPTCR
ncbi:hypothetical protein [Pseudoduganella umbonata]|uniref:MBL fold metallo-hydrolase n=1 Tax=Pseudoduganella umbonata TaxID=864828 RepID=A0A4P8HQU5_9BURK|nr:hypothetical protein [Pseudoduganella umbonata]MBB3220292.1 hypothetical protein [Pseudoduganella umbonata]QCP12167.1 hypothetical protein FCL38_18370 [Pseudoduganella umbonata]